MSRYPEPPFATFWRGLSAQEKVLLAADSNVQYPYLSMIANGNRRAGRKTIRKLSAVDKRIDAAMLGRPDLG
jgi:hypothetical protein